MDQAITTLIAVALGGIIGFISALYIDTRRRKYELKRQVYFEFIDLTTSATLALRDYAEKEVAFKKRNGSTNDPQYLELLRLDSDMAKMYRVITLQELKSKSVEVIQLKKCWINGLKILS